MPRKFEYSVPFNDEKLIYLEDIHQYVLNRDFASNRFGTDALSGYDDNEWDILTRQLSDNIYCFIYSFKTGIEEHDKMEYELAKNQWFREILAEALLSQFEYANTTNGDIVQLQHGINLNADKSLDISKLRGELMIATKAYIKLYYGGLLTSVSGTNEFDYSLYRKDY